MHSKVLTELKTVRKTSSNKTNARVFILKMIIFIIVSTDESVDTMDLTRLHRRRRRRRRSV